MQNQRARHIADFDSEKLDLLEEAQGLDRASRVVVCLPCCRSWNWRIQTSSSGLPNRRVHANRVNFHGSCAGIREWAEAADKG